MSGFLDLVDVEGEAGSLTWSVPAGWRQGRGAWGGLVLGAVLRAARRCAPDTDLGVRHLAVQMLAPVPAGPVGIRTEVLRAGSGTIAVDVRIEGAAAGADGEPQGPPAVLAHGTVMLGAVRADDLAAARAWPAPPPPDALAGGPHAVPVAPVGPPLAPEFLGRLECRPVEGLPYQGLLGADVVGWVGPRDPVPADLGRTDEETLAVMLSDAWWPAVMVALEAPRPLATIGLAMDLPGATSGAAVAPGPLLHRGRAVAGAQGYVTESRELWTPDGVLLAAGTHTMVVIR